MKKYTISTLFSLLLIFSALTVESQIAKICVISDPHVFDTSTLLINDGTAFQTWLSKDKKMIRESEPIIASVVDSIIAENPDIVLVPGDLTKDGELACHWLVSGYLQQLENAGIKVFVAPGNHDIMNPNAVAFNGDSLISVLSIIPLDFRTIYANFGFNEAIYTDTSSLSYIAEPVSGIWILSMDVCRYDSNYIKMKSETSGGFKDNTLAWVKDRLQDAKSNKKLVFGMMHHGLLEHYEGQKTLFPKYVIDDWDTISTQLADLGLQVVFTGHFHSQDIVKKTGSKGHPVYDIETGSTITYPCPYRIIELTNDTVLNIDGKRIEHVNYPTDTLTFQQYAEAFILDGMPDLIRNMLMSPPYNLDSANATTIEPAITESFMAHYSGDEGTPSSSTQFVILFLKNDSVYYFMGNALEAIWNDPAPSDWQTSIDLKTGGVGISESEQKEKVQIFPNPAAGVLNIQLPESYHIEFLSVFDNNGRIMILEKLDTNNFALDLSDYESGIYYLQLRNNGIDEVYKIILN
ncbi:metallophosphoesterase [candidate division KSB1 bacterium]